MAANQQFISSIYGLSPQDPVPDPDVTYYRCRRTQPLKAWENYFGHWTIFNPLDVADLQRLSLRELWTQPFSGVFGYGVSEADTQKFLATWQYLTPDRTGPKRLPLIPYRSGRGLKRPTTASPDSFPYLLRTEGGGDEVIWTNAAWRF